MTGHAPMLSYPEALERLLAAAASTPPSKTEELPLASVLPGRVLAKDQNALISLPTWDQSAMDGYAVYLDDLKPDSTGQSPILPVTQRIPAGVPSQPLSPKSAARIFTGAPIPKGAQAVVMQEYCEAFDAGVRVLRQPAPGENIRRAGEEITAGSPMLFAGTCLRPWHLAWAAAAGATSLTVFSPLKVAVFFTGNELYNPGEDLPPGGIYNANQFILTGLLERMGCQVSHLGHVADHLEETRRILRKAAQSHDLVITSGGVSVGDEDHVRPAVEAEGELDLWKVAIKPGKPLALGKLWREGKGQNGHAWFIGLPGNPVSLFVTFMVLARYFVRHLQGCAAYPRPYRLKAAFQWDKDSPLHEFLRVVRSEDLQSLTPFPHQGSGALSSIALCDGLAIKPPHARIQPGDDVDFLPFWDEWS